MIRENYILRNRTASARSGNAEFVIDGLTGCRGRRAIPCLKLTGVRTLPSRTNQENSTSTARMVVSIFFKEAVIVW